VFTARMLLYAFTNSMCFDVYIYLLHDFYCNIHVYTFHILLFGLNSPEDGQYGINILCVLYILLMF
jgi:hypothetical protein